MKNVLITTNRYKEFEKYLDKNRFKIIPFPTIKTVPLEFKTKSILNHDYILFTSINAVKFFFKKIRIEDIKDKKVIAVGEKTAEKLKELGFENVLTPKEFRSEGLIKLIKENWEKFENKSILVPRAKKGRELLSEHFKDKSIEIEILPIYQTSINIPENKEKVEKMLKNQEIDIVVFTSPSTFENFLQIFGKEKGKKYLSFPKIAVIGATTKKAIENKGLKTDIIPSKYTFQDLSKLL